jgi:hypothetical protein
VERIASNGRHRLGEGASTGVGLRDLVKQALSPYADDGEVAWSSTATMFAWGRLRR